MFAAMKYATMLDVMSHTLAGFAYFRTAAFHLPGGGVVILLRNTA
jgi:hypothetical protein